MWRSMVMGLMYTPKIITNGLVTYVDFGNPRCYPKSGTSLVDLSLNRYAGTLYGSPVFDAAYHGSLVFDGVNAKRVDITLPSSATSNVTIQGWVYVNLSKRGAFFKVGNNSQGFAIGQGSGTFDSYGNTFLGLFAGVRWIVSSYTFSSAGWYFVTMTLDGSGVPRLYVNKTFINSYSGSTANSPSDFIVLGTNFGDNESTRRMEGNISTFGYYNRQLTLEEISYNYDSTRGRYLI